jgi:hypothetical protein
MISLANEFEKKEFFALCLDALGDAATPESSAERFQLTISLGIGANGELDFLA